MVPVQSHNRLLASYEGARGGKTGFTLKARRCFVGEVDRGGVRLIVAILNSPNSGSLWQDARNLLDYGFSRYGLAPPPPIQAAPLPVLVRQAPLIKPVASRIVVKSKAARPVASTKPKKASARTALASTKPKKASARTPKPPVVKVTKATTGKTIAKTGKRETTKVARVEPTAKPTRKIARPGS
jgi:D-alanyl-D-alanine carboxypeptidase